MASKKKSRNKSGASGTPRNYSQLYKDDRGGVNQVTPVQETKPAPSAQTDQDWNREYGYVVRDLRSLAIVSVIVIGLMIGVGLLL